MTARGIAVYTTVYPKAMRFLGPWARSLRDQTDPDFDVWVGADQVGSAEVRSAAEGLSMEIVPAEQGDSPTTLRNRVLARMLDRYDAIVLIDVDDIALPDRVAEARRELAGADGVACAMRMVDVDGHALSRRFGLRRKEVPDRHITMTNVFGFSNTAYRTTTLRACLPVPADTVLMDWWVATRAWLTGSRLVFDPHVRMNYRQYAENLVPTGGPHTVESVAGASDRVSAHYRSVLGTPLPDDARPERVDAVERAAERAALFAARVVDRPERLARYVATLNDLEDETIVWWSQVAHPSLDELWLGRESDD